MSNGQMFVGLDENGLVHDFYYPYVGLENLTTARSMQHKIGVWVGGQFSWTDDGSWQVFVDFEADALISDIRMHSDTLQVSLHFKDYIDTENNAFVRRAEVTNEAGAPREIRLFMHQVFEISRGGRSDTALYVPEAHYVLDYKGRYSLLIAGKDDTGAPFDQYAVGNYAIEGKAGTFRDAEDGELSGNPVEHGGVDSVIRFPVSLDAGASRSIDYWIVAASSQMDAAATHKMFEGMDMADRLRQTRQYWQAWLQPSSDKLVNVAEELREPLQKSLLIIKAHCDDRGSVLASGDSSIYNYGRDYYCYCWPRDACYALWPLIRLGHFDEARAFFSFARDTLHTSGYLMHKYQPDRAIGSTWHPLVHGKNTELAIQEDETAATLFMIREFLEASGDRPFVENLYHTLIEPAANFLSGYIDNESGLPHATYDLWEQVFLTTTYSTTVTIAGLEAAAAIAQEFEHPAESARWLKAAAGIRTNLDKLFVEAKDGQPGYFRRGQLLVNDTDWQYNNSIDISSLYGPFQYARLPLNDPRMEQTLAAVEKHIYKTGPIGGVIRYPGDDYFLTKPQYGGNPWIVCTLWLAQYYLGIGRTEEARELLDWAMARRLPSGVLSEQFDPETGYQLGVAPLVWSHAELVNTILDLSGI
ncbi:MAG TPA: glycoside hydrolase family 15 protein [Candidatus Saccharibacteria bacterium]|nr:glycoside hydrolase family 15 protein [Candidatus Saccharibacteria bacterium]